MGKIIPPKLHANAIVNRVLLEDDFFDPTIIDVTKTDAATLEIMAEVTIQRIDIES